jgi:tetratricopeptide (TPR) repeat protein
MEPEPDPSRSSAKRIIDELKRQQRERANLTSTPAQPKQDPIPEPKKELEHETKANPIEPPLGAIPVDPVYLAQTLFRGQRYEEALTEFRKIDLKGKKQEERAPIIYLTAECLQRLGKTDEAIAMLRDVANSKGDEHMAEYAQWQIENLRWQRATQNSLQAIRSRLEELEKR